MLHNFPGQPGSLPRPNYLIRSFEPLAWKVRSCTNLPNWVAFLPPPFSTYSSSVLRQFDPPQSPPPQLQLAEIPLLLLLPRLFSCNAKKIPSPHGLPSLPLSIYPNFPSQTKHEFPSGKRTKSRSVKAGKREGEKVEVAQVQFLRETQVHRRLLFGQPIFSLLGVPKRALEKRIDDREFSSSPKVFPRIIQLRKK